MRKKKFSLRHFAGILFTAIVLLTSGCNYSVPPNPGFRINCILEISDPKLLFPRRRPAKGGKITGTWVQDLVTPQHTGAIGNLRLFTLTADYAWGQIDVRDGRASALWKLVFGTGWQPGVNVTQVCLGDIRFVEFNPGQSRNAVCRLTRSFFAVGGSGGTVGDEICEEEAAFCFTSGGTWKGCNRGCYSPIVVDINGDGFNLTNGENGVNFDLVGDGTKDRISWTSANSDDAWLALDRNRNGTIDNGGELFGNYTEQPTSIPVRDRNGFHALAVFDSTVNGGNGDGAIDSKDAVFADLRLWQDKNHNGVSESNELHTMSDLGILAIEVNFKESKKTDEHGNRFRYRAKVWDAKGGPNTGRWAWDVFPVRPKPWK